MELDLPTRPAPLPADVRAFLREANRRIEAFAAGRHLPGFVASDYALAYRALRALDESGAAPGVHLCEWGSGFGVVACLAAMLGFDACGVEAEPELVDEARRLADDFGVPAAVHHGSFLPEGSAARAAGGRYAWLSTEVGGPGFDPADFDVVYAYPWPDEEGLVAEVFGRHAPAGAVLVTYHGGDEIRARRKASGRGPQRSRTQR